MIEAPEGYRLLEPGEEVLNRDLWAHRGEFNSQWIRCKRLGQQLSYNAYCRKRGEDEAS